MSTQESYSPIPIEVNRTTEVSASAIGCFLCTTAGTISLTRKASGSQPALTLLTAHPVTAGLFYEIPFYMGTEGFTFTTAAGASGLLGVL